MKKYKPQKFGLNPEWVKIYILKPLVIITTIISILTLAANKYKSYAKDKAEENMKIAEIKKIENEKLKAEEEVRIRRERKILEEQQRQESNKQVEILTRITNTLYENEVTKKVIEGKKYWRNNELNKVGKVESIYGLEVMTNNNWKFLLDANGNIPNQVVNIGYKEYIKAIKKQVESERKIDPVEAYKTNQKYEQERAEQTQITKKYIGADKSRYLYFKLNDKSYRLKEIDGQELILIEKNTDKKIMINAYDKRLKRVHPKEYDGVK